MTAQERERIWLPIAGTALALTCIGSFVVAWGTMDWKYLIVTGLSFAALVAPI